LKSIWRFVHHIVNKLSASLSPDSVKKLVCLEDWSKFDGGRSIGKCGRLIQPSWLSVHTII